MAISNITPRMQRAMDSIECDRFLEVTETRKYVAIRCRRGRKTYAFHVYDCGFVFVQ